MVDKKVRPDSATLEALLEDNNARVLTPAEYLAVKSEKNTTRRRKYFIALEEVLTRNNPTAGKAIEVCQMAAKGSEELGHQKAYMEAKKLAGFDVVIGKHLGQATGSEWMLITIPGPADIEATPDGDVPTPVTE